MAVSAAWAAAAIGAAGVAQSADQSRQSRHTAMDARNAAASLETTAAQNANGRLAMRKKALANNSLLTGGGDLLSTGVLNGGKPTLGG